MFERFTDSARRAVVLAQEESKALGHDRIGTEHLLLGLVHEEAGPGGVALASFGLTLADARAAVEAVVGVTEPASMTHIPFTPRAKHVLETSLRESLLLSHTYVDSGHLLLGLLAERSGVAAEVLYRVGIDLEEARRRALDAIVAAPAEVAPAPATITPQSVLAEANMKARRIAAQLNQARAAKDAALDAGDFAGATAMREREKALLAERARLVVSFGPDGQPTVGPRPDSRVPPPSDPPQ
ncbi:MULTISPECIES: Clp protease N-terminal domain-containing protein [unclassified Pseudofrankia]|uniref:Clp protease N-terminal domain-containing protein n=1 Tax=unclassified Pseudofrankia TaxID=2994372 RepID=UPI0008DA9470|nr:MULTISPECIES: Clp protease N-terminal domain-containing protein [unclassified Pseudofrankia]MDT3440957.1 Clp protease N-terminal domain-containing protein [Pseudofrankia sp. BMG5.37]OHV45496.1 hypothetical protein BCD48_22725 [Pseudofrankia sp. BMG5.36]